MQNQLHESVLSQLKSSGMDSEQLNDLADSAAQINMADFKAVRVFTKGIPYPDLLRVSGITDKLAVSKLLEQLLNRGGKLGGIRIFPYGIPHPDLFRVDIDFGPGVGR